MRSPRSPVPSESGARGGHGGPGPRGGERGSAVVDFVLGVALLQLALGLHVRNVLTDAAGEGARRAALVGGTEGEAAERVAMLTDAALADGYVDEVTVTRTRVGGTPVVQAEVTAPLPVLGLFGPAGSLRVTGHAVDEAALVTAAREEP